MTTENTNVKTYPKHYSELDVKRVVFINAWIQESKISQSKLGHIAVINASTFSQVLSGQYPTSPAKFLKKAVDAITHIQNSRELQGTIVRTSLYELAIAVCEHARTFKNFGTLSAAIGTGKTCSLKDYADKNKGNVFFMEMIGTMREKSFLSDLAELVFQSEQKGSAHQLFRMLSKKLKETDSLLILDEAEKSTPEILECVRRLRDTANIGVVLSGNESLRGIVTNGKGIYSQIGSRCSLAPAVINRLTTEDIAALLETSFGNEIKDNQFNPIVEVLEKIGKGTARIVVESIFPAIRSFKNQNNGEINLDLIKAIAKDVLQMPVDNNGMLLCLKKSATTGA